MVLVDVNAKIIYYITAAQLKTKQFRTTIYVQNISDFNFTREVTLFISCRITTTSIAFREGRSNVVFYYAILDTKWKVITLHASIPTGFLNIA